MPSRNHEPPVEILPDSLGCMPYCSVGKDLLQVLGETAEATEKNSGVAQAIAGEAQDFVDEHPCEFVKDGKCRIADYLIEAAIMDRIILDEHNIPVAEGN